MKIKRKLLIAAALATAAPTGLVSQGAFAQGELEEIIVTGSYIKRNREELSTPVDVYDRSEFEAAGSPTAVDIIQNMPAVSGTVNRSDQFVNGGTIVGLKNVNIRGLGLGRTLVLLNGKRIVNNGSSTNAGERPVDIGNFPNIALQRIELLKSGGSTTYGTDAVAGVYNFITRGNFEGLEVQGSYSNIDGSDGDSSLAAIWGVSEGNLNWVTSVEYTQRTKLSNQDIGTSDYGDPTAGGWGLGVSSFGNPGTLVSFARLADVAAANYAYDINSPWDVDPTCGQDYPSGGSSFLFSHVYSQCGYNYVPFSNAIDPQKRLKVFSEMELDLENGMQVYGEVLYSKLDADYYGSPSYPPTNPDAGYFTWIPIENPGFQNIFGGLNAISQATYTAQTGSLWWGRSLAGEGPSYISKGLHDTARYVFGLRGDLPWAETISFDISANYSTEDNRSDAVGGKDILTARFDAAVSGFGGELCDPDDGGVAGDAATGGNCSWFNPFGSSIGADSTSDLYNDPAVRQWFTGESSGQTHQKLFVLDAVFTGESVLELPGGPISWATGVQWRHWERLYRPTGDNRVDSASTPNPFHFLTTQLKGYIETRNYGFFAEGSFPVWEGIIVDAGLRYEDYGPSSVTKPKISARYDILPELAIRASFEQVFRSPVIGNQATRSLELVDGDYVTIETPVPTDLTPEEADSINVGFIYANEGWNASIDYYMLNMDGPFARESISGTGAETIYAADGISVVKIIAEAINGDAVEVAGVDFQGSYTWDAMDTMWEVGLAGHLASAYDVEKADGSMYDAKGKYNTGSTDSPINIRSVPDLKLNAFISAINGPHFVRLYVRYISEMDVDASSTVYGVGGLTSVDQMVTADLHYTLNLNEDRTRLGLSFVNIFDEDAPWAPHEIGYDGSTHSPLGRVVKVSVTHAF
jgi:outer membrane receptor protein involved in Fe transport